jgi:hypothetical protein
MKKLVKPKPKTVKQLDYSACMKYLEQKYKFESRDYAQSHKQFGEWRIMNKEALAHHKDIQASQDQFARYQNDIAAGKLVERPYLDFWHFLADTKGITNGGTIHFDNDDLNVREGGDSIKQDDAYIPVAYHGWRKKIIEHILAEFGKGKNRECSFVTEW